MFEEFDEILAVEDPVDMARRLDEQDVKLERMARSYAELDRATESLRVTETDPSGAIAVTVDAQGRLLEVRTGPVVARLAPEQVGPRVLACVRRAQAGIAARVEEVARQTVGEDEMAVHVVSTLRERFPAPEPASPPRTTADPAVLSFGWDDSDDDPPRRSHRRYGSRAAEVGRRA
ncbi:MULTISPECIES: YbaB/EbfC family nucleoid-associated protein [Amycolatopsis]|uniref:YbaB/EbfC DNA-binding family protein n=1 Tax=Amycolatopsis bullii TaxID=941987 RepID=A0ABQ3KIV6_9PSEU|nr:YbaB/EbfC family nucleoid-associated protein [Amycolatopsis bullii]GHG30017.1 hypothetical protein GCM10017567_57320 [Amycolatopsis bullii]